MEVFSVSGGVSLPEFLFALFGVPFVCEMSSSQLGIPRAISREFRYVAERAAVCAKPVVRV